MKKMLGLVVTVMLGLSTLSGVASFTSNLLNPANIQSVSDDVSVYFDDLMSSAIHSVRTGDFDVLSMIPKLNHTSTYQANTNIITGFEATSFNDSDTGFGN